MVNCEKLQQPHWPNRADCLLKSTRQYIFHDLHLTSKQSNCSTSSSSRYSTAVWQLVAMHSRLILALTTVLSSLAVAAPQQVADATTIIIGAPPSPTTTWPESLWAVKPTSLVATVPTTLQTSKSLGHTSTPTNVAATTDGAPTETPVGKALGNSFNSAIKSVQWWAWTLGAIGLLGILAAIWFLCCRGRDNKGGDKGAYEPAPSGDDAPPAAPAVEEPKPA